MALPNYEKRVNEMKNLLKYSTDEQKVGTWVDGKPIYKNIKKRFHSMNYKVMVTNISMI